MPKCGFNKVAKFIEITLRHGCSPVNTYSWEHLQLTASVSIIVVFLLMSFNKKMEQINKRYRKVVLNDFEGYYETLLKNSNKSV